MWDIPILQLIRTPKTLEQAREGAAARTKEEHIYLFAALGRLRPRSMLACMQVRIESRGDMTPADLRAFAQHCDRHADELERRQGK